MVNQSNREQIIEYIKSRSQTRVDDLWRHLKISRVLIHRYLKEMLGEGKLARVGKPPLVFYIHLNGDLAGVKEEFEIPKKISDVIENDYLYVSPLGEIIEGIEGFLRWVKDIKEDRRAVPLAKEYVQSRSYADSYINRFGYINATKRIGSIFPDTALDRLYYLDFYSLPKFGKTKLPRKYQFQKEMEKKIASKLPRIELVKAYIGDIPVAQKTLSKLEDRVINARGSIFIKNETKHYKTVLLVDDAVGSGATMNETAVKLKQTGVAKRVIGLAVVGSYKGFDVIREI